MNLGELVGTFILIFGGLGSGFLFPKSSRWLVGLFWGVSILIGSVAGSALGSADMNIVFSLSSFLQGQLSLGELGSRFCGQVVGSLLAVSALTFLFRQQAPFALNKFAAVASQPQKRKNFGWEFAGTLAMMIAVALIHLESTTSLLQNIQVSLFIAFLIGCLAPITGASFNPIRDFIPRIFYCRHCHQEQEFGSSLCSSNLAPLCAGLVGSQFIPLLLN